MKKLATLCLIFAILTGCSQEHLTTGGAVKLVHLTLDDGRVLECLRLSDGYEGSIDCNWDHPVNETQG